MESPLHPREALFDGGVRLPPLPVCEHYAGTERFIAKARELRRVSGLPFDLTLDLEDGAGVGAEADQLELVLAVLRSRTGNDGRIGVRVHDPAHPFFEREISSLAHEAERIDYLTIPKIVDRAQGAAAVGRVQRYYHRSLAATGRLETASRPFLPLHLLIETHGALAGAADLARCPGVEVLDFGIMDFISSHDGAIPRAAMKSPEQFRHPLIMRAKTEIVAQAIAAGVVPSHNVTIDIGNPAQAGADARQAYRELGFLRMWSIHPSQIEPIINGMRPEGEEIDLAVAVLSHAGAAGWGPIRYDNELFDRASYRYLWSLLERAERTGAPIPEEGRTRFFAHLTSTGG